MRKTKFLLFLFSAILISLFYSCGSTREVPAPVEKAGPPHWVQQYPIDRQYFIGIASAPILRGSAQHISQARDAALAEIASSITIQIISESESRIREANQLFSHTFEERISSFAKQDLEGYELVDSWEGDHHYWVYYRLCKDLYLSQVEEKIRVATNLAADLLNNAESDLQSGDHAQAIRYHLQAYNNIADFIGYGIETYLNGEKVFLENHIWKTTQDIIRNLKIEFSPSRATGKFLQGLTEQVKVVTVSKYHPGGSYRPVTDMPLKASFIRGNGQLTENIVTGADGTANLSLSRISSPLRSQAILVKPDIKAIAGNLKEEPAVADMINNISLPGANLTIDLETITFCIDYADRGKYNEIIRNAGDGIIRSSLSEKGFEFTSHAANCNYILKFDANLRRGTVIQNIHTAFCNATIYFISDQDVELMSFSVSNVSGADLGFEKAKQKAVQNATNNLIKRIDDELF